MLLQHTALAHMSLLLSPSIAATLFQERYLGAHDTNHARRTIRALVDVSGTRRFQGEAGHAASEGGLRLGVVYGALGTRTGYCCKENRTTAPSIPLRWQTKETPSPPVGYHSSVVTISQSVRPHQNSFKCRAAINPHLVYAIQLIYSQQPSPPLIW